MVKKTFNCTNPIELYSWNKILRCFRSSILSNYPSNAHRIIRSYVNVKMGNLWYANVEGFFHKTHHWKRSPLASVTLFIWVPLSRKGFTGSSLFVFFRNRRPTHVEWLQAENSFTPQTWLSRRMATSLPTVNHISACCTLSTFWLVTRTFITLYE